MNLFETKVPMLQTMSDVDLRQYPEYSQAVCIDWRKVGLFVHDEWPSPYPAPHFLGADMKADLDWHESVMGSEYVVFDVETEQISENPDRWSKRIFQVGLYGPGTPPAIWDRTIYPEFEETFVEMFRAIIENKMTVAHNAQFDVGRIRWNFGVEVSEYIDLHCTITMHHILWPEFPHNLEFIASMVSEHRKVKHLGVGDHDYLIGDVVVCAEMVDNFMGYFERDPASYKLYREELNRMLPGIIVTMQHGFPVNDEAVIAALEWCPQHVEFAEQVAASYCGFDISLNSAPQLRAYFDGVEDIYELAKKAGGYTIRRKLTDKGELSFDKDTVNELRKAFLPIDHNEDLTPELVEKRIEEGAHPLLEAKALHGKARLYLANYIKPLLVELDDEGYYEGTLHVGDGSPEE